MPIINNEPQNQIQRISYFSKLLESQNILWGAIILGIGLIIVTGFLYGCNRSYWQWDTTIDNGLLGNYGDFIGGTVGVILTFVGTILIYRTLKNQIDSNIQTIRANGKQITASRRANELTALQIFDSNFQMLFSQYRNAVKSYKDDRGHDITLREVYKEYYNSNTPIKQEWTRRSQDAVQKYEDIYTKYREHMSVHFRLMYLMFKLIYESAPVDSKVMYAKLVRGQMTDSEILFLRYNCMTAAGLKMQKYVNKYNLIKHLPFMEMLEAKKHRNIINDGELSNALNILIVSLKKWLTTDFYKNEDFTTSYNMTEGVVISFKSSDNHHTIKVDLKYPKPVKPGGGIKRPAIERALVIFDDEQLKDFGVDIINEIMRYSNFKQYSNQEGSILPVTSNTDGIQSLSLTYQSSTKIFMSQAQKDSEPR